MNDLVSTDWLDKQRTTSRVTILDATMFMPGTRDAASEFRAAHIPGAQFFDIDAISDPNHPAPHMLPTADAFGRAMEALGVGRDDRIVVYDNSPLHSATRAWFMLRHFGAPQVAVLDGGFGKWTAEGRTVESGKVMPAAGARFDADEARREVVAKQAIINGVGQPMVDARSRERFDGRAPDPRPGVAPGHIPGSRNLPLAELYRPDGTMKNEEELRAAFRAAEVDPQAPFIATCGSGVTATSIILAARRLGGRDAMLYDGSWSEWGADPATPKATTPTG
jgi:thiosulfate/3-mercaptopyruvate sulfurtransferase